MTSGSGKPQRVVINDEYLVECAFCHAEIQRIEVESSADGKIICPVCSRTYTAKDVADNFALQKVVNPIMDDFDASMRKLKSVTVEYSGQKRTESHPFLFTKL